MSDMHRILEAEAAFAANVSDVSSDLDGAVAVADGRAPDLGAHNQATLVRADADGLDALLQRIVGFYVKRGRTPAFQTVTNAALSGLVDQVVAAGWSRAGEPRDLSVWNPSSPHLFTAPEVYMTQATNATLSAWLDIAIIHCEQAERDQYAAMLRVAYRSPGATFWFGLCNGAPAATCPLVIHKGVARVGPICVAPTHIGKGVGLALLNYVTRQSRKDGADLTYTYVVNDVAESDILRTAGYEILTGNSICRYVYREVVDR